MRCKPRATHTLARRRRTTREQQACRPAAPRQSAGEPRLQTGGPDSVSGLLAPNGQGDRLTGVTHAVDECVSAIVSPGAPPLDTAAPSCAKRLADRRIDPIKLCARRRLVVDTAGVLCELPQQVEMIRPGDADRVDGCMRAVCGDRLYERRGARRRPGRPFDDPCPGSPPWQVVRRQRDRVHSAVPDCESGAIRLSAASASAVELKSGQRDRLPPNSIAIRSAGLFALTNARPATVLRDAPVIDCE